MDNVESERLCFDLYAKVASTDYNNQPSEVVDMIKNVVKSMRERECMCPCFHKALLYNSIMHDRKHLLALLLSDEENCKFNSLSVCEYASNTLLEVLEQGRIQAFLGEDSTLPTESGDLSSRVRVTDYYCIHM